jgi:hypothetical protein
LSGCEGEADAIDAGAIDAGPPPPAIVGDWFTCDGACSKLRAGGMRFTEDLRMHHLVSPDGVESFREGDAYCVTEPFATYLHEGRLLTMTFHDGSLEASADFEVDDGGVTALRGAMLKVTPNAIGRWDGHECSTP